jgi:hypothetical protein
MNHDPEETLQRVRRIETRLCRLSEQLGVVQSDPFKIECGIGKHGMPYANVQGMDTTLSAIYNALLAASIDPLKDLVRVGTADRVIALITFVKD